MPTQRHPREAAHQLLPAGIAAILIALACALTLLVPAMAFAADSEEAPDQSTDASPEITTQATGIHFAKLELRKGSIDGTVVCDLLTDTNPSLEAGQEYYLCVECDKDAYTDDCWVSISLPWWTTPVNMIGGSNWMTPGASVTATALDKVVDYSANTGYSSALTSTAGKVTYHIKSTAEAKVQKASFEISFKPTAAYFDTQASGQTWTNSKLSFAVGDMNGETAGAATQTISTGTVTVAGSGGFRTYATKFPNTGLNTTSKSSRDFWISGAGANTVWKTVEFDATYPIDATVGDITFGGFTATKGTETTNPDGTKTIHCKVETEGSQAGGLAATASFSTATLAEKTMTITNVTATSWGDETTYTIPGSTDLKWYVYDGPGTTALVGTNITRFDWLGQEGVTNDMLVGFVQLKCNGGDPMQLTSTQTISVDYADNLTVRAISVPLYEGHGTTITLNGTSYDLATVAAETHEPSSTSPDGYAIISASKANLSAITSCQFEVGRLQGGATSTDDLGDYADTFSNVRLGSWGSFTDGKTATSSYTLYSTGTDPTSSTNTSVRKADAVANPTATKTMTYYSEPNGGNLSKTAMMAGDVTHFTANFTTGIWPKTQGVTSAYDDTEAYYLTLPAGFKVSNLKLAGTAVTPEDITSTCTSVPSGMKIYRVAYPAGQDRQTGAYTTSLTSPYQKIEFDLTTSPYLNAGTYNMKDILTVGTDPNAKVKTDYSSAWGNVNVADTYGVNGGHTLTAPSKEFTIQPYSGVSVTNSMTITKNGTPLNTPLIYNEADAANTVGVVNKSFQAEYTVSIANQTDKTASDVETFVAVPKVGQDFGAAFSPNGAQQFDLTFTADSVPDGWTVHYLKMNAGKTYDVGTYPQPGDYTEVTDPAQADMIMISGANAMGAGASTDVTFKVTSSQDLNEALSKQDTWGCISRYEADGSELVPTTTFPEALKTSPNTLKAEVTKTVDHETLKIGQTGTYSITVKNTGDTNLTGYFLVDTMPSQLSYSSCSDSGAYDSTARTITWKLDLAAGASKTVTVSAVAKEVGTADNVATLYSPDPTDPTKPDTTDPVAKDDATVTIDKSDVTVNKTGDKSAAVANDQVTYTITVTNPSDVATTGVYVYDKVPANTTLVSYSGGNADDVKSGKATDGTTYISWFFKTLDAHETQSVTMTVRVNNGVASGTVIKNTASFEISGELDPPEPGTEPRGKTNEVNVNVTTEASKVSVSATPETGDQTNAALPAGIALLGACGIALSTRLRRERR